MMFYSVTCKTDDAHIEHLCNTGCNKSQTLSVNAEGNRTEQLERIHRSSHDEGDLLFHMICICNHAEDCKLVENDIARMFDCKEARSP